MKPAENIIFELAGKKFSLREFWRENITGILTTVIFHLIILIGFLIFKIDSYRQIKELGVVFDFTYEPEKVDDASLLSPEELEQLARYERLLEQAMRASNRPANISEQLERQISTENFVNEVERMLQEMRSEEETRRLQELQEKVAEGFSEPEDFMEDLQHTPVFQGPTRISYEFMDPPYNRYSTHIPVPIYTCQGGGVVEVEITVDRSGNVSSARPVIIGNPEDAACLAEAAVKYASLSKFTLNTSAPRNHKGKIRYTFVAQ